MLKSTLFLHIFKNVPFKIYTFIIRLRSAQVCSKIAPKALHFSKIPPPPPKNGPQPPPPLPYLPCGVSPRLLFHKK